jgi:hypothetical protein
VLPTAPELLPEEEMEEVEEAFDAFAGDAPEAERAEQLDNAPVSNGAFAAMESDAPPAIETAPVAASDAQPD